MPAISLQHVVSCSSADTNNPAENLLKPDGVHKWRGQLAGEKSLSAVLQLSKSSQIHSIDIGNEGSAFVEILVGKATASADKDFEVLLVASSFMSPLESRNGTNRNSVRMFGPDKLNKVTSPQKWDRVKIVCSQPFSKLHQYGLSFIKFHSPPETDKEVKVKKLGAFTLKSADDDDDDISNDISVGSAFANRSRVESVTTPKAAAAVRAATRVIQETEKQKPSPSTSKPDREAQKRRADSPPLAYNNNLKTKISKVSTSHKDDDSDTEEETKTPSASKPVALKKQSTSLSSVASSTRSSEKTDLKRTKTLPPSPSPNKAYGKLMENVVFVLSGFQNPYRGELRDTAMEMGATYKPDWGRGCTHLICAFSNTPKYQQVRGKGRIVTKKWIAECSKQKRLLPWRKYRLGDAPSPDQSSEEEEPPQRKDPPQKKPSNNSVPKSVDTPSSKHKAIPKKGKIKYQSSSSESEPDTEDEIQKEVAAMERRERLAQKKKEQGSPSAEADPYAASTDEEGKEHDTLPLSGGDSDNRNGSDSDLPELPDFFTDKRFFFYGDFNEAEKRLLTRYIAAYNGEIEDYMNSKVNFVVTSQKWDDNFDDALAENPNLIFTKPKWITTCHEKKKYVPYQPHVVTM